MTNTKRLSADEKNALLSLSLKGELVSFRQIHEMRMRFAKSQRDARWNTVRFVKS